MTLTANVPHEAWNPAPQPSLEVEGVTVAYPNGNVALRDATFGLGAGTIAGLVGVNGSGKSTLFKAIMASSSRSPARSGSPGCPCVRR